MICPACKTDNSDRAVYCMGCGRKIAAGSADSVSTHDVSQRYDQEARAEEIRAFGQVYWSDELWVWQLGISFIAALLTMGVLALILGLLDSRVILIAIGLGLMAAAVAILFVVRRHPRAADYSSALYGPYRLGESESQELRGVYEKITTKPPRR